MASAVTGPSVEDYNRLLQELKEEKQRREVLQALLEKEKSDHSFTHLLMEDEIGKVKLGIEVIRRHQEEAKEWRVKMQEMESLRQYTLEVERKLEVAQQEQEQLR